MREMNVQKQGVYEFGEFRLDAAERLLSKDGRPVQLSSKAFDLLVVLLENGGRLVGKEELFETIWPGQFVEESNLTVHVSQIRKALGETKKDSRFIETVPGYGYRFVGEVSWSGEEDFVFETETVSRIVVERETPEDFSGPPLSGRDLQKTDRLEMTETGRTDEEHGRENRASLERLPPAPNGSSGRSKGLGALVSVLVLLCAAFGFGFYLSRRPAGTEAASIPFSDAKLKQLTTKGKINWAAISPDGKFFAYALGERGENKQSLWLGQTDGSAGEWQLRPPADGVYRGLEFSPDGKSIYFIFSEGESVSGALYKMPALGGLAEKLPVAVGNNFTLSPDGKQIAFTRRTRENNDSMLLVADLGGAGERVLLTRSAELAIASWKPAFSPDGRRIAFAAVSDPVTDDKEFFVVGLEDGRVEQLTRRAWINIHTLVWRADGRGIITVAMPKEKSVRQLWHIEYPNGSVRELMPGTDGNGAALTISADGKSLLSVQIRRESNVWTAPADDLAKVKQITFSSVNGVYGWNGLDWTSEGNIVFTAGIDHTNVIYAMDSKGENLRQLTPAGFYDRTPRVAPGGRTVVFSSNRSGSWEIWSVSTDGSDLRQLTFDGGASSPFPTPDGKWIIYAAARDGKSRLRRIGIDGGPFVGLTDKIASEPSVSPGGELVACAFREEANAPLKLAVLHSETGEAVKIFDVPRSANFNNGLRFTPDGKAVTYRDWSNGIWKQNLDGGAPEIIGDLPAEKIYSYTWSPDGKHFAYARGREISDVVLISEFK